MSSHLESEIDSILSEEELLVNISRLNKEPFLFCRKYMDKKDQEYLTASIEQVLVSFLKSKPQYMKFIKEGSDRQTEIKKAIKEISEEKDTNLRNKLNEQWKLFLTEKKRGEFFNSQAFKDLQSEFVFLFLDIFPSNSFYLKQNYCQICGKLQEIVMNEIVLKYMIRFDLI
jgi:hypothetical protein